MPKIILSYRRTDSEAISGRIFDRLTDHYGSDSVFMDIDNIPFGTDFRSYIQTAMAQSDLVVAVIGPRWLGPTADGSTRIAENTDPIRVEVESACQLGKPVIPVLVDGASMPSDKELPASLRDFAFINAAPVDNGRDFRAHMDRLIHSIDNRLASAAVRPPQIGRWKTRPQFIWLGTIIVCAIAAGGLLTSIVMRNGAPTLDATSPSNSSHRQQADATPPAAGTLQLSSLPALERPAASASTQPPASITQEQRTASIPSSAPVPRVQLPPPVTIYRILPNASGGVQNLRHGPAVTYPIVVAIPVGETGITINGCRNSEDGTKPWCAAKWGAYSGWISSCCIVDERTGARPPVN